MNILIVEPGKHPYLADIPHTLEDMQQVVGGHIEIVCPFTDPVVLVCDEEGKLKDYEPNRLIPGLDIIAGTFFLAGIDDDDLADIPEDLVPKYERIFGAPQAFVRSPRGLLMISEDGSHSILV